MVTLSGKVFAGEPPYETAAAGRRDGLGVRHQPPLPRPRHASCAAPSPTRAAPSRFRCCKGDGAFSLYALRETNPPGSTSTGASLGRRHGAGRRLDRVPASARGEGAFRQQVLGQGRVHADADSDPDVHPHVTPTRTDRRHRRTTPHRDAHARRTPTRTPTTPGTTRTPTPTPPRPTFTPTPTPTPTSPPTCPVPDQAGDTFATAGLLTPGVAVDEYICPSGDLDLWRFPVNAPPGDPGVPLRPAARTARGPRHLPARSRVERCASPTSAGAPTRAATSRSTPRRRGLAGAGARQGGGGLEQDAHLHACASTSPTECYQADEAGNTFSTATPILPSLPQGGVVRTHTGYICPQGDEDYYRFPVSGSQTVTIDAYLTDLPADFDLLLLRPDGSLAASSINSGTASEHVSATSTNSWGDWRVVVYGPGGSDLPREPVHAGGAADLQRRPHRSGDRGHAGDPGPRQLGGAGTGQADAGPRLREPGCRAGPGTSRWGCGGGRTTGATGCRSRGSPLRLPAQYVNNLPVANAKRLSVCPTASTSCCRRAGRSTRASGSRPG